MSDRKLATIRVIDNIEPIEGADRIVKATIGGWQVVTAIDNGFKIGDLVIYFEIDSWIPNELAPFLTKPEHYPKEYNGVKGERLKTIRLRKVLSQGLIMPLSLVGGDSDAYEFVDGQDMTEALNIQKWERPMNAQLAGMAKGNFPNFIFKTDQERIQNLSREFADYKARGLTFEVSEKLEGSSMTVYYRDGEFGVCSRNLDLKETEGNTFWQVAKSNYLHEMLFRYDINIALQGELIGPGIQGNIYNLKYPEFRLFDIFNIDTQTYWESDARNSFARINGILQAPHVATDCIAGGDDIFAILKWAEGLSQLAGIEREGIVFKCLEDPSISFKAISNQYLIKQKD